MEKLLFVGVLMAWSVGMKAMDTSKKFSSKQTQRQSSLSQSAKIPREKIEKNTKNSISMDDLIKRFYDEKAPYKSTPTQRANEKRKQYLNKLGIHK